MEFVTPVAWFGGWSVWVAEAVVCLCYIPILVGIATRHKRIISFSFEGWPRLRTRIWLAIILLILHELIGWKLPLGIRVPVAIGQALTIVGVAVFLLSYGLMRWAFAVMGKYMTPPESKPDPEQATLVVSGPYRLIRNPTYLSYLGQFVGAQLIATSPLVLLAIPLWLAFRRWAAREEEIMEDLFPLEYPTYRVKTPRGI